MGGFPRGGKLPIVGSDDNTSTEMEGTVVKVTKAVSSLMVSDKGTVTTILGAAQTSLPLGQEGRVARAPSTVLYGAASSQEDRIVAAFVPANQGQEGLGLAGKEDAQLGVLHGQEGHALQRTYVPGGSKTTNAAADPQCIPAGQEGQGRALLAVSSTVSAGLLANVQKPSPMTGLQDGQLLFQPGVLEALSGAVAARLAAAADAGESDAAKNFFIFSAEKTDRQGHPKNKGRSNRKAGVAGNTEDARKVTIGKKKETRGRCSPDG